MIHKTECKISDVFQKGHGLTSSARHISHAKGPWSLVSGREVRVMSQRVYMSL
jgi:hypothetical protein